MIARCAMCGHELPFEARPYRRYLYGWCECVIAEEMRFRQEGGRSESLQQMREARPVLACL